ncbi:MAG: DUF4389 domain-containing protein [Chloroflexota bacterium]|nr:DUF4389 domain-containing protein [Chloroflexota bacterium]
MTSYPVIFDVERQETYDKTQVVIRLVIVTILSILSIPIGLIYLAIPVAAAVLVSQRGAARYFAEAETNIVRWLRFLMRFYSYLALLTDTFPNEEAGHAVHFSVTPIGTPTAGNILLRIILAIPHAIVLGLLGVVAGMLGVIAAIMILVQNSYPEGIFAFLRGYLRWYARVFVYLAGLADAYPPFALDTGPETQPQAPTEQPQPM